MSSGSYWCASNSDLKPGLDTCCRYSEFFPKALIFVKWGVAGGWILVCGKGVPSFGQFLISSNVK